MPLHRHHDAIRSDFPFRVQKYYICLDYANIILIFIYMLHFYLKFSANCTKFQVNVWWINSFCTVVLKI